MVLFSVFAPGVSSSFSWASIRSIAFLMTSVASVWDERSGFEFGAPAVIASMPLRRHGTSLQFLDIVAVLSFSILVFVLRSGSWALVLGVV